MATADVCTDSFEHAPLDTTRQQIRLICIKPGAAGQITCQLENAYFGDDKTPDYRAISYEWGSPTPLRRIVINGRSLEVRQNLYAFLEAFRARLFKFQGNDFYEAKTQWLWIDQICINQTVITERNHQVKMMSEIYSRAAYVYVWLGQSQADIETAMTVLKSGLRRYYEDRTTRSITKKQKLRRVSGTEEQYHSNKQPHSESQSNTLPVPALRSFFLNTYWERLWIVQEIMLAKYIRIMCGETLLSWEELRKFCLSSAPRPLDQARYCIPPQVMWLANHALSAKHYTYTSLLTTFGKSQCHDPKDKVYGLQGLIAPESRVTVDYAKSISEVFRSVAWRLIRGSGLADHVLVRGDLKQIKFRGDGLAAYVQVGSDLEQLDYNDPAEAMTQASSILAEQIEVNIRTPLVTALVELGNQMGLPLARMYATCIGETIQKRTKSLWSQLVKYYLQERSPALLILTPFLHDDKEFCTRKDDSTGLFRDLWEAYEELEFLHTRFLHWTALWVRSEQYIYDRMFDDHKRWKALKGDWYLHLRTHTEIQTFFGYEPSSNHRIDLEMALEKVAFNICRTQLRRPDRSAP